MNTMQRKTYADAALDLITSLDNDLQSLTGQADNCLKELDDPTKDDYEARNKAYEYATIFDKTTGLIYTVKYLQDKSCYVVQKRKTSSK